MGRGGLGGGREETAGVGGFDFGGFGDAVSRGVGLGGGKSGEFDLDDAVVVVGLGATRRVRTARIDAARGELGVGAADGEPEVGSRARGGVDDVSNPRQDAETGDEDAREQDAERWKERNERGAKRLRRVVHR